MPNLIDKLSTYAALVGVVAAIGGGFYAWGEFNTRLNSTVSHGDEIQELIEWKNSIGSLNTTQLESRLSELETKMERVRSDIRDNKNDAKDDLNDAYDAISDVEKVLKEQKKEIRELLKEFEESVDRRIERALDNPLSS